MKRIGLIAMATVLAVSATSSAFAQQNVARPGWSPNNRPYVSDQQRQAEQRRLAQQGYGFWPGDVAAGVVGGALGAAGAIATAPFGGPSAFYDDRYRYERYARRNGFVCEPGTWFQGEDGRAHLCQ